VEIQRGDGLGPGGSVLWVVLSGNGRIDEIKSKPREGGGDGWGEEDRIEGTLRDEKGGLQLQYFRSGNLQRAKRQQL